MYDIGCTTYINIEERKKDKQNERILQQLHVAMFIDDMRRCIGRLPGGPAGNGGIQVVSATCWTNLSGRPLSPIGSSRP